MFNQNLRLGAYGILVSNSALLLVLKKSGPYKGLYELPGGKIEFSETPEEALSREFEEEVVLFPEKFKILGTVSNTGMYREGLENISFHHIGLIYRIEEFSEIKRKSPEEEYIWIKIKELITASLSPIAKKATDFLD